jgi:hypothetical protein
MSPNIISVIKSRRLGKLRCRWGNIIRMDLGEIGWEGVDCMHLV